METAARSWTLAELAHCLGGTLDGPGERRIARPVPAGSKDPDGITFAESAKYLARVSGTGVGAVVVPYGAPPIDVPTIHVAEPREAFGRVLAMFDRPLPIYHGIHSTAIVSPEATIAEDVCIGPYAVVERNVTIARGARVFPFAYIGENCRLGEDVVIYPNVVLYRDVRIGDRSIVHAGAVLGADGFGYEWDSSERNRRIKIPQVGGVSIGPDVEIGAITAVDRATAGDTVIRQGVKIDNLVQVGHNTVIGDHAVIAGQVAIGGSSTIGARNDIAGQVAISDHVHLCDDLIIAGFSGVSHDMPKPGAYWGVPARPFLEAKRISAVVGKLPELLGRIKELEARLSELEKRPD